MVNRLSGKKVVGIKQTIKSIKNGEGSIVYIAKDADIKLVNSVEKLAMENSVQIAYVDTMKELGKLCGIDVGAASALILE
ncbi:large subunit ribosomal protein L7A [Clostridium acidisoli DSM 12555]|jgi:large subunit ribosomal protein L7A|uniref:Large subunit ribosomal protein L7A n=1 Tax=Clostridium acidisoli DSM 12555 TaxID=1121291 RepID=A0A1W1Y034_9CLOT|nr:ribosomal L7Ae/L30e/S12e/Gadd45 family protein [Clostridium acidisoli]SMC29151.1 large subunit ribosomal protein L7A [Clostridium acidisoli DSM 12555]